ncbi:RNA polymerase sigma-70 factor [Pedobacter frigoris]|uniref:RNA polymerase sigma factor n=1 Tax=Pedobacter frigoris TaxID=2571272 RepID=UPI00292F8D46|nr:RNA polymerase sigma-70 factor [Pedobacter frigoris]
MANYSASSDMDLIGFVKAGDQAAFHEIYNRYAPKVFYQMNQMLRDREAAQDLVQELFITLWSRVAYLRPDTKLGAYLYIAAQNSVFKQIQKGKLKNDFLVSLAKFTEELDLAGDELLMEKELEQLIDAAIEKLPPKMKQVFELSRKENLSYQEIAQQLNISTQTVKNQVSTALRILREDLGPNATAGLLFITMLPK